jgi:hypothetical protein
VQFLQLETLILQLSKEPILIGAQRSVACIRKPFATR